MQELFRLSKGEQYSIEFTIINDSGVVTPDNVDDMRIKVGNTVKTYSKNEISFSNGVWIYRVTQEESLAFASARVYCQAQYKVGSDIFNTDMYLVKVDKSILLDEWTQESL